MSILRSRRASIWLCAVAALALACGPPEPPVAPPAPPPVAPAPPPPPAPSPEVAALPSGVDASYTLRLVKEPFPFVEVTFVTHGNPRGETRLGLDDWASVEEVQREIHDLRVTDDAGHPLVVDRAEGDHGPRWTVHHATGPGALLHVRYALVSTQYDVGSNSSSYYRPLLQPAFFHAIGETSLVDVSADEGDPPADKHRRVAFHWRGFREAGWKVACSYSVEPDFEITEQSASFRHAVFIAGDIRLVRRNIGPNRSPLWMAIAGSDWGFTDDAFADTAAAVVAAQRGFFQDDDWPYFFISVIPVGQYSPGSSSSGGTGLNQSFALFLSPRTALTPHNETDGVPWLLSHELFHLWNGSRYELDHPEPLGYWFSEGFTNFYARRLLFRARIAGPEQFVASLDEALRSYTLSPVRREPATRIAADFWKDRAVELLPYQRGDVVALVVDAEIRKVSHGDKSLDDLMKELLAQRDDPTPKMSTATFLGAITRYTSPAFADRIRKVVVGGAALDVDPKLLEPCLHGHVEPIGPYDPGFDTHVANSRQVVAGVVPGSAAYKAGLRNGQPFASFRLDGDSRQPMDVAIWEGKVKREFHYSAQGKPVPVVQFTADATLPGVCAKVL